MNIRAWTMVLLGKLREASLPNTAAPEGFRMVHFVKVFEKLGRPLEEMFERMQELHDAGYYKNVDHVYGYIKMED